MSGRKSEIETRDRDQVDRSRMLVLGGVLGRRFGMEIKDGNRGYRSWMELRNEVHFIPELFVIQNIGSPPECLLPS